MSCGSCDYWQPVDSPTQAAQPVTKATAGLCRRHAPVIDRGVTRWPITFGANECGDYQPHLTRRLQEVTRNEAACNKPPSQCVRRGAFGMCGTCGAANSRTDAGTR